MKTDSPCEKRESQGWCQEILRVMNWNLLIRDWKIQPEPDPIQEYFRGRTVRRKGGRWCCLYLPGGCAQLTWRKPWHPVWGREGLIASRHCAGQEVECTWSGSQSASLQVTRGWKGAPVTGRRGRHTPKPRPGHCAPVRFYSGTWNLHPKPVRNLDSVDIYTDVPRIWPLRLCHLTILKTWDNLIIPLTPVRVCQIKHRMSSSMWISDKAMICFSISTLQVIWCFCEIQIHLAILCFYLLIPAALLWLDFGLLTELEPLWVPVSFSMNEPHSSNCIIMNIKRNNWIWNTLDNVVPGTFYVLCKHYLWL